jgi:hypothetical protein
MALTAAQQTAVAAYWANVAFANAVANYSLDQIAAAAAAIDAAFDTTLTAAVAAVGGGTTVINGLASVIPAPFSGATAAQRTLLACHVLMKRAGII